MKNYIYLDGKKIPISEETAKSLRDSQKEELNSFEDCWNKVIANNKCYYLDWDGIVECKSSENYREFSGMLPREEIARKVQLYIKLLVVAEALNDGWTIAKGETVNYVYYGIGFKRLSVMTMTFNGISGHIYFKDKKAASRAIEIAGDIFREYFEIQ